MPKIQVESSQTTPQVGRDGPVYQLRVAQEWAGERFDRVLVYHFPHHSRNELQNWIRTGRAALRDRRAEAKTRVAADEWIEVNPPAALPGEVTAEWVGASVAVEEIYADDQIIVVAKPAGQVVHPGPGHLTDTLVNGLLRRYPELARVERSGIVHRLDRDTTGLLCVARTPEARAFLIKQFKVHRVERRYTALVEGVVTSGGKIEAPIGRHPKHRTRMAVVPNGRRAVTSYRVLAHLQDATLIEARLETGRTHQVRVHMAHLGHPVLRDPVYGGRPKIPRGLDPKKRAAVEGLHSQALHASYLGLDHPSTGRWMAWESPPPPVLQQLIEALERG